MRKNYETVFIVNSVLSEDQMKDTVNKFVETLKKSKCKIINKETWGLRKLAYPISQKKSGYYAYIEFEAEVNVVKELETEFSRNESIMRFLTIVLDKHSLAYNEKRRTGVWKNKKTTIEEKEK